ncbi:MAG TPA: hypothetical protein VFV75_01345 [Candidatus Polarisedimenticolaceae bacterium]|nr:hypothetical protein [Candidatus Polarisedimenticolaceae bacterium]
MKRLWIGLAALLLTAVPALASTVIGMSVEDQARLSRHVVLGTIVSQVGIDDSINGIETEVTIKVRRDFKSVAKAGDVLTFHTRSGQVGEEVSIAVGEAVFHSGRPVLVFLEDIDGTLYNLGLSSGVFDVHEGRRGEVAFTRALQDGLEVYGDAFEMGPIPIQAMARRVAAAMQKPEFDNPILREARVEN